MTATLRCYCSKHQESVDIGDAQLALEHTRGKGMIDDFDDVDLPQE